MSSTSTARSRIDAEPLAQQGIAVRVGLGPKLAGVDVVQLVEMVVDADRLEHPPGIRRVAVGEDQLAARQPGKAARQPVVAARPGRAGWRGRRRGNRAGRRHDPSSARRASCHARGNAPFGRASPRSRRSRAGAGYRRPCARRSARTGRSTPDRGNCRGRRSSRGRGRSAGPWSRQRLQTCWFFSKLKGLVNHKQSGEAVDFQRLERRWE